MFEVSRGVGGIPFAVEYRGGGGGMALFEDQCQSYVYSSTCMTATLRACRYAQHDGVAWRS